MSRKVKLRLIIIFMAFFIFMFLVFICSFQFSHKYYAQAERSDRDIIKRRLPYPYKSALTICSDIDETNSLDEFLTIQEFLTTKNTTDIGVGLGLEIGNSFFPIKTREVPFALDLENPMGKEVILDLINLGYIDTIHSFVSAGRKEIREMTNFLENERCKIHVWVNHSNDPTNIGDVKNAWGDNIGSNYYHTDFSIKTLGVNFVWTGEVSSIIGQGIPLSLYSFFDPWDRQHLLKSLYNNVFKEIYKYSLSFLGKKYSGRRLNDLTYPLKLDDGHYVFGFIRNNVFYQGIGAGASTLEALAGVLREDVLKKLNENKGYMIVYAHFGKNKGYPYISENAQTALRRLEREYTRGNTYVTTTKKLLEYYVNNKYLTWHSQRALNRRYIYITSITDPVRRTFVPTIDDLRGITFYTDDPINTHILIQDMELKEIVQNDKDDTNRKSIMIPLKPLTKLDQLMREYKEKGYFGTKK